MCNNVWRLFNFISTLLVRLVSRSFHSVDFPNFRLSVFHPCLSVTCLSVSSCSLRLFVFGFIAVTVFQISLFRFTCLSLPLQFLLLFFSLWSFAVRPWTFQEQLTLTSLFVELTFSFSVYPCVCSFVLLPELSA